MKNSISTVSKLFLLLFTLSFFSSCEKPKPVIDKYDLASVLNACKGHAIVITKGYNKGNYENYRNFLIIRDDSLNCYEYIGSEFEVSIGDTLK